MEVKHPRSPTSVETLQERSIAKKSKLVLKPPKFITEKQKPPNSQTISLILEKLLEQETSEQVLESLIQLIDSNKLEVILSGRRKWPLEEVSKCLSVVGKLAKLHRAEIAICCILVHILEILALKLESDGGGGSEGCMPKNLQMFVLSLVDHDDADVKVSVLKCLFKMVTHYPEKVIFGGQVLNLAQRTVNNIHHGVRIECLKLIGQLCHVSEEFPLNILEEHCVDPDPRVRSAAFQALYHVQKEDPGKLGLSVYLKASESLADKYSDVRTKAVKLVWALGLHHHDKVVPLKYDSSVELRLLDDAFVKICDLVNDTSKAVRALVFHLLGDFHMVSEKFLAQTLDKKLMSHLKVVKSDHQRQQEIHQGGGVSMDWDSGRKWRAGGGGAPKIELNPREISLMTAGACGAFVHGLEDEFMEVRSAAVGSMCELGMKCRSFAGQSLDYLVDMFNDEIEAIRLKAINSLCRISSCLELREDQLETVLSILEETSSVIRDALRELLSSCHISTSVGLNTTIHSLLVNLKKYPHDCQSIWKCLQKLGGNHGYLISSLVPELLSAHPFFMGKEPDMDDPAYICVLILVFNAAANCPTIPPLFPSHVFKHYTYLRDTLPHLIPYVKIGMPVSLNVSRIRQSQAQSGTRFLSQVLARAQMCSKLSSSPCSQSTLSTCIADLLKMASLDKEASATNKFAAIFLQCQLLVTKVNDLLSQDIILTSDSTSHHSLPTITSSIRELFLLSYRLENVFCGLSPVLLHHCRMVRVMAHTMSILLATHLDIDTEQSVVFVKMKQGFMERLQKLKEFCTSHDLPLPALIPPILEMNLVTVATETLTDSLQPLTCACVCSELPLSDILEVRECKGLMLEPQNYSREDFLKFVSSLALEVHVEASLSNIQDSSTVAIQVKFPDGRELLFPAKPSEVRMTSSESNESRLDTSVILSHGVWTDPSQVEFSIVKRFTSDIIEGNSLLQDSSLKSSLKSSSSLRSGGRSVSFPAMASMVHSAKQDNMRYQGCVLAISDVVKVNIHPQEKLNNTFVF